MSYDLSKLSAAVRDAVAAEIGKRAAPPARRHAATRDANSAGRRNLRRDVLAHLRGEVARNRVTIGFMGAVARDFWSQRGSN